MKKPLPEATPMTMPSSGSNNPKRLPNAEKNRLSQPVVRRPSPVIAAPNSVSARSGQALKPSSHSPVPNHQPAMRTGTIVDFCHCAAGSTL